MNVYLGSLLFVKLHPFWATAALAHNRARISNSRGVQLYAHDAKGQKSGLALRRKFEKRAQLVQIIENSGTNKDIAGGDP